MQNVQKVSAQNYVPAAVSCGYPVGPRGGCALQNQHGMQTHLTAGRWAYIRRVSWVLLPVCFLAAVLNYLDRTNLSFAALELNADLGFTPVVSEGR